MKHPNERKRRGRRGGVIGMAEPKKRCWTCRTVKPLDQFWKNRSRPDGRSGECAECERPKKRAHMRRRLSDPEFVAYNREKAAKWASDHPAEKQAQDSRQYHGAQGRTRARASNSGKQWTGPELEIALRPDLTEERAALALGRTLAAVRAARAKARRDPRFAALAGLPRNNIEESSNV